MGIGATRLIHELFLIHKQHRTCISFISQSSMFSNMGIVMQYFLTEAVCNKLGANILTFDQYR